MLLQFMRHCSARTYINMAFIKFQQIIRCKPVFSSVYYVVWN